MAEYTINKIKLPNNDVCNLKDSTAVSRSGDTGLTGTHTTTGWIHIKNPNINISQSNNNITTNTWGNTIILTDKNDDRIGYIRPVAYTESNGGKVAIELATFNHTAAGQEVQNTITVIVDKNGNQSYSVANPAAFCTAINALNKAGDTRTGNNLMTDNLGIKSAWPGVNLYANDGEKVTGTIKSSQIDGHVYFETADLNPDSTIKSLFNLPVADGNNYNILTSKNTVSGQFTTANGKTVKVTNGLITEIS